MVWGPLGTCGGLSLSNDHSAVHSSIVGPNPDRLRRCGFLTEIMTLFFPITPPRHGQACHDL
ncbi:hypothetical protein EBZ35_02855 [bacterium]|nr:hypothetical protein [bacterium]